MRGEDADDEQEEEEEEEEEGDVRVTMGVLQVVEAVAVAASPLLLRRPLSSSESYISVSDTEQSLWLRSREEPERERRL